MHAHQTFGRQGGFLAFVTVAAALLAGAMSGPAQPAVVVGWKTASPPVAPSDYSNALAPDQVTNLVAISCGDLGSVALKRDGRIVVWGNSLPGQAEAVATLSDVAAVSEGYAHVLALRSNGVVVAWGNCDWNQNAVPAELSGVIAVSAGGSYNLALKSDHTVVAWGDNRFGQLNVPAGLSGVTAISASPFYSPAHCLALKNDGTVVAWGDNTYGQLDVPAGLSSVVAISAGWYHSLALKIDGTVTSWGRTNTGGTPPPGLTGVVSIAASAYHSLALKQDGTVVAWRGTYGSDGADEVPPGLSNVLIIAAGTVHSLALSTTLIPIITSQPGGGNVEPGALRWETSVLASGAGPFGYQWQKDGAPLPGATNRQLTVLNPQVRDAGSYRVVVSNPNGSATSELATLSVFGNPLPVRILTQPQVQSTYVGGTATFMVEILGADPVYQWYRNFFPIPGATNATLAFSNVQFSDAGTYNVAVQNAFSSDVSYLVYLTVTNQILPPVIATQPRSDTMFPGAKFAFRVQAGGAPPLSYQWRKGANTLAGETGASLSFASIQSSDAGDYTVVVSNAHGSVTSSVATLSVTPRPPLSFPAPSTVVSLKAPQPPPGLTNIIAIATGLHRGVALRGDHTVAAWYENDDGLSVLASVPEDLTNVVSVAAGDDYHIALLDDGTVRTFAPGIVGGTTVSEDLYGVVAIAAARRSSLALKHDGTVVSPGSSSPISTGVVSIAIGGNGFVVVVKQDGTAETLGLPGPGLDPHSRGSNIVAAAVGSSIYYLTAAGTLEELLLFPPTMPEGLSNVIAISGGFNQTLALRSDGRVFGWGRTNVPAGLSHVTAIAAGLNNLVLTDWPVLVDPPRSLTVDGSTAASFHVTAAGAGPLGYQWQKNGVAIPGATDDTLTIPSAQADDEAVYTVVVSNAAGSQQSLPATLSVNLFPTITSQPRSETVFVGAKVGFIVAANGGQPLSYQWTHDGATISGASDPGYVIASAQASDAGTYRVIVSNTHGSVTSAPALLQLGTRTLDFPPPGTVVNISGALLPSGLTNIVAISAGRIHALALREDRTVVAWANQSGQIHGLSDVPSLTNVIAISAGDTFSLALLGDGTVVAWGEQSAVPDGLYGVVAIAAGNHHSVALKIDGTVVGWGQGPALPSNLNGVKHVAAGGVPGLTLVAKEDGSANLLVPPELFGPYDWPSNVVGVAIGSGAYVLTSDGAVRTLFQLSPPPIPEGLSNVVAISARGSRNLALRSDGTVVGWGNVTVPAGLTNVSAIAAGGLYNLVITTNPPPPMLAARLAGGEIQLAAPVSVSGFVLEATDDLSQPYAVIEIFSNPAAFADAENPVFSVPASGAKKFYRLRKF